jgi:hypothetical protein
MGSFCGREAELSYGYFVDQPNAYADGRYFSRDDQSSLAGSQMSGRLTQN